MVAFTEARDAAGAQAAITLVPGWVVGGVAVDVEVRAGVAAVGPAVPARHRPVAKGGHLPADLLAANVAWRGQFPSHVLAVLVGFLVQVPDFDDLLGGISVGIAAREVRRVQILRQRRPDGEAELEQVLERQAERRRQITAEGWTPEHDDEHSHGQMARASACYALAGSSAPNDGTAALLVSLAWPWDEQWWKPSTARRDLVKACALALAEIERLDRAAADQGEPHDA